MIVAAVDLVAMSRALVGRGGTLAQRAGGQVHAGGQLTVRVAGELGVRMVEGIGVLHGIEAHDAEGGVSHGAGMALGEHQPVTVFPAGILGVKLHDLPVQYRHQVRQIHRSAHMPEAPGVDDLQSLQPDPGPLELCMLSRSSRLSSFPYVFSTAPLWKTAAGSTDAAGWPPGTEYGIFVIP